MDIRYARVLKWINTHEPQYINRWIESVSPNQIDSKRWLTKTLCSMIPAFGRMKRYQNDDGKSNIEIVGGWFGFPLIQYLHEDYKNINRVTLYDIDPIACRIARKYVESFAFNFDIRINEMDYFEHHDTRRAHIVINTSQEHMPSISSLKEYLISPEKSFIVLQSNNMFNEPDHSNCVNTAEELSNMSGLSDVIYKGDLPLGVYNRFMVMGTY